MKKNILKRIAAGAIAATLVFAAILTVASGGTAAPLVIGGLIAGSLAATGAILNKVFLTRMPHKKRRC